MVKEGTYANELVEEDAAEVGAGGNVGCEDAGGAARREQRRVEGTCDREGILGLL